jgi:hypothetical protein
LDSILEKRAWGERYISNAFPYLLDDVTQASEGDLTAMKKCFLFHYKKYESFKKMDTNSQIPTYNERKFMLMENQMAREMLELQSKEIKNRLHEEIQSEAEDLYNLNLDNWNDTKGKRTSQKLIEKNN